ncbi:hypothetical protein [Streptomyces sp. NPDC049585]|uniref:hypothetical protein n=1 Tax=Streptomyces sp. NPDC049585 TaxID=3155154 RepID=UPI00341DCA1A
MRAHAVRSGLVRCSLGAYLSGTVLSGRWTVHGGDPAVAERFHHRGALVAFVLHVLAAGAMVGYVALTGWRAGSDGFPQVLRRSCHAL